jgi:hypothetical protein
MKKHKIKKILWISLYSVLFLAFVLALHIYVVTRPKAPDRTTKIMARFDFKQSINKADVDKITAWLYSKNGVDHVMCNEKSGIAVFTYYPVKTNADKLLQEMKSDLHYSVNRYMPSKEQMAGGCPIAAGSFASKIYHSVSNLFN